MFIEEKTLSARMGVNLKGWRHKGRFEGYKIYYKVSERTIVYDENALFNYIREQDGKYLCEKGHDMGVLISEWQKDTQINKAT
jgi:hypothetical protein